MKTSAALLGLGGVGLVGAVAAVMLGSGNGAAGAIQPPSSSAVPVAAAAPVSEPTPHVAPGPTEASLVSRTACEFKVGDVVAYSLHTESSVLVPGLNVATGAGTSLSARLDGRLELLALKSTPDGAIIAGKLEDVVSAAAGVSGTELESPFLLEVGRDCALRRFARAKAMGLTAARNQQSLLWEAQFSLSAANEFQGQNGRGEYLASLEVSEQGRRIERTLRRYVTQWGLNQRDVPANGRLVVLAGEGPWFETLQSRESRPGGSSALELKRVPARNPFSRELPDEAGFVWENLLPQASPPELVARPFTRGDRERQARVAPMSLEQVMADFDKQAAGAANIQEAWKDLSAYFEVHPVAVSGAVAKLRANQLPATSIALLYTSLGKARVAEARDALLEIRRDVAEPPMDRVRATFNLLDRADVGLPLAKELAAEGGRTLTKPDHAQSFLRGQSLLALGMMYGLRGDPETLEAARAAITQVLGDPTADRQAIRSALKAIGNTGHPGLMPLALEQMRSADFHIRMAAAHVFRRMPVAATEDVELQWLAREKDPFVKHELYSVIRSQHFDAKVPASQAMTAQALSDLPVTRSPIDRKTIIRFVAQGSMAKDPEVRKALVAQARFESQKDTPILNEFTEILSPDEVVEVFR